MGRAGDGADDDVVELEAELFLLRPHLLGEADIAEPAELVHGGTGRNRIGLAALGLHILQRLFPARADANVEALVDQLDMRTHHPRHQDVADPVIDRILMRHPALLHEAALHPDLGGGRRDHAGMVRLHPTDRDQRVGAGRDRIRDDIFELAQLVAAEGEAGIAVLALGVERDAAAEMGGKPRELLDRRRPEGQGIAFELGEHGGFPFRNDPQTLAKCP